VQQRSGKLLLFIELLLLFWHHRD